MKRMPPLLPLSVAAFLAIPAAFAAPASSPAADKATVSSGRLDKVRLLAPKAAPKALVIYFSDRSGWQPSDDAVATALVNDGDAVLAVDLARYGKALDADNGECLYVVGELTDLAQTAQRQLDLQTYLPPILAGTGEGATFAYAALADAPANTLGGAVAAGFANRLTLKLPFCPGATAKKSPDGKAYSYAFDSTMPEAAALLVTADKIDEITAEATTQRLVTVSSFDADDPPDAIVQAVSDMAENNNPFGDLPAIDLPSTTDPRALAILISGDGGWRDLDKTMGEWLSTKGVHVVGLDALHYFWSKRTPQQLATDMAQLIDDADPTHHLPVMLIGYSFGADVLPFAFPLLPKPLQDRTKVLALLAPGLTTSFQVTVEGWLGIDDSGYQIAPAIAALPAERVICVYGEEEDDSSCPDPSLKKVTQLKTEGGHHFDGDYAAIAQHFLDRL